MKKTFKIINIFILIIVISLFLNINAQAYSIKNIFTDAQNFTETGNNVSEMIDTSALKNTSSFIFNILYSIGIVTAVAVGVVLGIQFMVASAADKAKIKETLIAYVVGCLVLFGAYPIWKMIVNLVQTVTTV